VGNVGPAALNSAVTLPRFLVAPEALAGTHVVLVGKQLRHLHARRLRVGSTLVLSDGMGRECHGTVMAVDRRRAVVHVTGEQPARRDSPLRLTLAQALLKSDKLDWVIEKTTELGVTELVFFSSERTVGRAASERHARWARVARSAAQQSQRSTLPVIIGPVTFDQVLAPAGHELRLLFWEQQAGDLVGIGQRYQQLSSVLAVIGPEGGFSAHEAERAVDASFQLVGLSPRILRAETAAVAVATLCQFLWGDLGKGNR
jgi:16S rRNA (uracil1498-N3)-methyltransferase